MYMSYTTNPHMPRVRKEAVKLILSGWSTRDVARHLGYSQAAIVQWKKRAPAGRPRFIYTRSSRPLHHPNELSPELVGAILAYRRKYRRCAEVIHHLLREAGIETSLSSVKRTIKRNHLTRFSKWKKWHRYPPRPVPEKPGFLIEIDTILDGEPRERLCAYTLLDVFSRWAYALPREKISTHASLKFVEQGRFIAPFPFRTIQSDHGAEFSKWFTKRILERGMAHRHSRVRQPNDNAHLERFNRTLQEECLSRIPRNLKSWRREIPEYLNYYNNQRPHMALQMQAPLEVITSY